MGDVQCVLLGVAVARGTYPPVRACAGLSLTPANSAGDIAMGIGNWTDPGLYRAKGERTCGEWVVGSGQGGRGGR